MRQPSRSIRRLAALACVLATVAACVPSESREGTHAGDESAQDIEAAPVAVRLVPRDEVLAISGGEGSALLLDVRSAAEFADGHITNSRNIPVDELASRLSELESAREREIIVYCERGGRAQAASDLLLENGFTMLGHMEGDMSAWRAAGLATE